MKLIITCLFIFSLLAGCNHQQVLPDFTPGNDSRLQPWIGQTLTPYLATQLQMPRFRNQAVIVVKLDGEDVLPEIDLLTRNIRQQVNDTLLEAPGITLPWQPKLPEYKHHRQLSTVQCRNLGDSHYYIGIETSHTVSGEYRVAVRALDIKAREWVSGFGITWTGRLTDNEKLALKQKQTDESLRGLRILPFTADQTDLAANYLANNISCLLQQQDEEELLVHVQVAPESTTLLSGILKLIGNNLSQYREVMITSQPDEANFTLSGESHELESGLHQVWTVISKRESGVHLSGIDTSTYIHETLTRKRQKTFIPEKLAAPALKPFIDKLSFGQSRSENLNTLCKTGNSADCRLININTRNTDSLFVVHFQPPARLSRIYPNACAAKVSRHTRIPETQYVLPLHHANNNHNAGTVYAIAVNGQRSLQSIDRLINELPDACSTREKAWAGKRLERWLTELETLMQPVQQHTHWLAARTNH